MKGKETNLLLSQTLWTIDPSLAPTEDQDRSGDKEMVQSPKASARNLSLSQSLTQDSPSFEDKLSLGFPILTWHKTGSRRNLRPLISDPQLPDLASSHPELQELNSRSQSAFWRWNLTESTQKKSKSLLTKTQEISSLNSARSSTWVKTRWTDYWTK